MRFKELVSVTRRTHLADPVMHYHQIDRICYEFDTEVPAHTDGELFFSSRFDIDVAPGALRTIINPAGDHYFSRA
jgi:diacylglycerol kinase family enzyme